MTVVYSSTTVPPWVKHIPWQTCKMHNRYRMYLVNEDFGRDYLYLWVCFSYRLNKRKIYVAYVIRVTAIAPYKMLYSKCASSSVVSLQSRIHCHVRQTNCQGQWDQLVTLLLRIASLILFSVHLDNMFDICRRYNEFITVLTFFDSPMCSQIWKQICEYFYIFYKLLNRALAHIAEILPCRRPWSVYSAESMLWLMLTCRRQGPVHYQPWYWQYTCPGIFFCRVKLGLMSDKFKQYQPCESVCL